jgi:hypothetical protein
MKQRSRLGAAVFDGGHIAAPQDGAGGDSGSRTWVPAEVWRFFTQFPSTEPEPEPEHGACRVTTTVSAWNTGLTSEITIINTGATSNHTGNTAEPTAFTLNGATYTVT